MKFAWLSKRYYTHKDLITDKFGRLYHIPEQLGRLGHSGLVIAGDYRNSVPEQIATTNVNFLSLPLSPCRLLPFIVQSFFRFKDFKPDIIIAGADSYLGFIGLILARLLKIPFVFDVFDDYSSFASDRIPGMRLIYHFTLRRADLTVAVSKALKNRLSPFIKKGGVVRNGVDTQLFRPIPKGDARQKLSLPENAVIVGYFGSINQDRGIDVLMNAVNELRKNYPEILLFLAGHNNLNLEFTDSWVEYRGLLPQSDIPLCINACDVVVIPYLPNLQDSVGNACKISEYMACKVPIVATKVSDHEEIFADSPQILCDPGNPVQMATAIDKQIREKISVEGLERVRWESLTSRLEAELKLLVK